MSLPVTCLGRALRSELYKNDLTGPSSGSLAGEGANCRKPQAASEKTVGRT